MSDAQNKLFSNRYTPNADNPEAAKLDAIYRMADRAESILFLLTQQLEGEQTESPEVFHSAIYAAIEEMIDIKNLVVCDTEKALASA